MRTLFLSFAAGDQARALGLAEGLGQAGHLVRLDRQLSGDVAWWSGVLAAIQESDAFLLALTHASLGSPVCLRGREHAVSVGVPVLLVRLDPGANPAWHGDLQTDFVAGDAGDAFRLVGAIAALPARTPAARQPPLLGPTAGAAPWDAQPGAAGWGRPASLAAWDTQPGGPAGAAGRDGQPGGPPGVAAWDVQPGGPAGGPAWDGRPGVQSGGPAWDGRPGGQPGGPAWDGRPGGQPGGSAWDGRPGVQSGAPVGAAGWGTPADAVGRDVPPGTLTETAVHNAVFSKPSLFRTGYEEHAVDDFLDLVEADLRARREAVTGPGQGGPLLVSLTAADVQAVVFKQAAGRNAYDETEVDAFLEQVQQSFVALDAELQRRGRRVAKR